MLFETKATADTELDSGTPYAFTIGDSDTEAHGKTVFVNAENKAFSAAVALVKLDEKSGERVDGATFELSYVPEGKTESVTSTTETEGDNKSKRWV